MLTEVIKQDMPDVEHVMVLTPEGKPADNELLEILKASKLNGETYVEEVVKKRLLEIINNDENYVGYFKNGEHYFKRNINGNNLLMVQKSDVIHLYDIPNHNSNGGEIGMEKYNPKENGSGNTESHEQNSVQNQNLENVVELVEQPRSNKGQPIRWYKKHVPTFAKMFGALARIVKSAVGYVDKKLTPVPESNYAEVRSIRNFYNELQTYAKALRDRINYENQELDKVEGGIEELEKAFIEIRDDEKALVERIRRIYGKLNDILAGHVLNSREFALQRIREYEKNKEREHGAKLVDRLVRQTYRRSVGSIDARTRTLEELSRISKGLEDNEVYETEELSNIGDALRENLGAILRTPGATEDKIYECFERFEEQPFENPGYCLEILLDLKSEVNSANREAYANVVMELEAMKWIKEEKERGKNPYVLTI